MVSNGTISGKQTLSDEEILYSTKAGGVIYFFNVTHSQLWKTDGTPAGTEAVNSDLVYVRNMAEINSELYFSAYDSPGYSSYIHNTLSLRKINTTNWETVIVKPGVELNDKLDPMVQNMFIGKLENVKLQHLWKTDGTETGTVVNTDLTVNFNFDRVFAINKLFMTGLSDRLTGIEPWVIDPGSAGTGKLGNYVWLDENKNGVQDEAESGLADVTVNLEDCRGNIISTPSTDTYGYYQFKNLAQGRYQLRFFVLPGYQLSPRVAAGDYRIDSNPYRNSGEDLCMSLADGQVRLALDAGMYKQ